jgi:hypothetical protein
MNKTSEKKGVTFGNLNALESKEISSKNSSILKAPLEQKYIPSEHLLKYKIKGKPFVTEKNLS